MIILIFLYLINVDLDLIACVDAFDKARVDCYVC